MIEEGKTPEGYKGTEIAIIPEDWDVQSLGTNSILKARIGWQGLTTAEYLTDGEYYLITGTEFINGRIDWDNCYYVKKQRYQQDRNIQVRKNDILVTKDGTIGKVAFIDQVMGRATLNSGIFAIRPLKSAYEPEYLYHILMSRVFRDFLDRLAAGSTISHLYQKDFVHFEFPIPSITEQKAISEVLTDTDNLILLLEKLINKKKKIKQGAMQHLLTGKKRLPGFSGDWENDKVKNIASVSTGSKNTQDNNPNGKYPFFVRSSIVERIDTYSFDGEAVLTAGDGVGTGKVFHYINGKFDIHQRVYKISDFCSRVHGYYFYLYFSFNFLDRIMAMTAKSSVDSVRMEMIADMEILLPKIQEQKAIAQVLSDMDAEIEGLEEKLEKYKTIKQGMMQELLTGRIRLI